MLKKQFYITVDDAIPDPLASFLTDSTSNQEWSDLKFGPPYRQENKKWIIVLKGSEYRIQEYRAAVDRFNKDRIDTFASKYTVSPLSDVDTIYQ